jgi:hypothetical protein
MEPFSLALGGVQALMSLQNMMNSSSIAAQNLAFQRQQAQKQEHLSQATRTDSYGNKQYYDAASNTWKTELSPMQQAIQDAGQTEQYRGLTEDAQRNRQSRKRQADASETAVSPFNQAVQEYMNNPVQSEGSIRNDLSTLGALSAQDQAKGNQGTLIKEALRMGRGGDIQSIIKGVDDASGKAISGNLLNARQQALQEHTSRESARNNAYLPAIQQWQSLINGGGGSAPIRFSDTNQQLANMQNNQASGMLQALQGANSNINSASQSATTAAGKTPDFSGLIKALSANSKTQAKDPYGVNKMSDTDFERYIIDDGSSNLF